MGLRLGPQGVGHGRVFPPLKPPFRSPTPRGCSSPSRAIVNSALRGLFRYVQAEKPRSEELFIPRIRSVNTAACTAQFCLCSRVLPLDQSGTAPRKGCPPPFIPENAAHQGGAGTSAGGEGQRQQDGRTERCANQGLCSQVLGAGVL